MITQFARAAEDADTKVRIIHHFIRDNLNISPQVVIYTGTDPYFCSGGSLSELFSTVSSPTYTN